jgi:hypothetical protein
MKLKEQQHYLSRLSTNTVPYNKKNDCSFQYVPWKYFKFYLLRKKYIVLYLKYADENILTC